MKRAWSTLTSKRTRCPLYTSAAPGLRDSFLWPGPAASQATLSIRGGADFFRNRHHNPDQHREKTVTPNASAYVFASLPAANYSISVSGGFKTVEQQGTCYRPTNRHG
jgi:hypothetical protein